jgi:transketolase
MPFLETTELARRIRTHALAMTSRAGSSHVGSVFSMADILAVLYNDVLRINPAAPRDENRDRFILSKGHACAGLYAVLAERGFFPTEWLSSFYEDGARLPGHATRDAAPGIELSTGSLGHGLPVACGMALAAALDRRTHRVFALLSDGECDEGSTWEAALFAAHHRLGNLVVTIDYNGIQSLGAVDEVLRLEPFADKWRSFGWVVREVDGHDVAALRAVYAVPDFSAGSPPICVIAHTTKGKGVSFMENQVLWHYRSPRGAEYVEAAKELGA